MAQSINHVEESRQDISQEQLSIPGRRRHALSGWPMIIAWLGMIIFALHASTHMVGAGDTWVAMACGRHFLNHGVDTVEPFSANSHKQGPTEEEINTWPGPAKWLAKKVGIKTVQYWHPTGWINQNWLTHVLFYWLTSESPFADAQQRCFNTLVFWKFAVYIITIICVYYIGRFLGVNPMLSAAFACFALFTGRSFFDVRPAGFSNLLVAVFFLILVLATYRNILYLWLIVPTVVLWCNLHGGYIYAFMMLVPFFVLHLLVLLPKRWTVSLHCVLGWMLLYAMGWKFLNHQGLTAVPVLSDRVFQVLVLMIIASIVLACAKRIKAEAFYAYHILISPIVFLMVLPRFFPANMRRASAELSEYVRNSQLSFVAAFFVLIALGLIVTLLKNKLVCIKLKGIYHTAAVGFVSLVAVIVFNPFHLTNLTHTFIISISKQAERWRSINEWHPAFEWKNPVGTGFPFLVLCIMFAGLTCFWLYSRFFKPNFNKKIPKGESDLYRKKSITQSRIFSWSIAVFTGWVTFVGFSFLNLDPGSFLVCALFVIILLLSILKNIHYIYLEIPLVLGSMAVAGGAHKYIGLYIYPFVLISAYVITNVLVSIFSKSAKTKPINIIFPAATAAVTLVLMVAIFNPFRLGLLFSTNLGSRTRVEAAKNQLNMATMPQQLRSVFRTKGILLSSRVTVTMEEMDSKWLIAAQVVSDSNNAARAAREYVVKAENNRLSIWKPGWPVWKIPKIFSFSHPLARPWRPAYEGEKKLDYTYLFPTLHILNILLVIVWLLLPFLKDLSARAPQTSVGDSQAQSHELPPIDIALIIIAALTMYMAYRSRRFIPIAAITACPILALFIDQMVRNISAARNYYRLAGNKDGHVAKQNHFIPSAIPRPLELFFSALCLVVVLGLGTWWSLKFKRVYLDAWPTDPKLTSVFMRMTASDAKPFYTLDFIRENNLKGNMFNYWTEGGFIAWGQNPDPNTGKTPLRLFMDGRAQAAYDRNAYDNWANIMAGGHVAYELYNKARARGRKLNGQDYAQIGKWISAQLKLKENNVWTVLMPAGQFDSVFVRGLERDPEWQLLFLNNKQKLFVDTENEQAQRLLKGILNGKTKCPDDFHKNLIMARILLSRTSPGGDADHRRGFELAIKAFEEHPSQTPMRILLSGVGFGKLRKEVIDYAKNYYDKFIETKDQLVKKNGYHHRLIAALVAGNYLQALAKSSNDFKLAETYEQNRIRFSAETRRIIETKRW